MFAIAPLAPFVYIPANTKHLYNICTMLGQCRRRWADVVQMVYKCFVFAGIRADIIIIFLVQILFCIR